MSSDTAQQVHAFMQTYLVEPLAHLFAAVLAFRHPDSQFYWPFLLSTLVVALAAWRCGTRDVSQPWHEFRRRYLSRKLWWHPSARVDYRYYIFNAVVYPLTMGPALFTSAAFATGIDSVFGLRATPANPIETGIALKLAYTVIFFVAYDFGRFVAHSALHDIPILWEFHKVHHSAEVLTPFTAFRAHPIDLTIMAWGSAIATGIVTWVFQRIFGQTVSFYTFLETHVLLWAFNLLGNLKHWQVPISYGRVLDSWLISPGHHQIHHSAEPRHFGRNRGFELAIWDRLYGTFYSPAPDEPFPMGLGDGTDGRWHRLWRLYLWPVGLAVRRLVVAVRSVPAMIEQRR